MASLLSFYKLMRLEKLIPIMGVEFYFVNDPLIKTTDNRRNSHLILLAKNYEGFQNLCRLSKLSFTDGYYYKPRIGYEWLAKHSEGLICLTACQGGVLANEVWSEVKGRPHDLIGVFSKLRAIFADDLYVEFQGHNTVSKDLVGEDFDSQALINEALYSLRVEAGFKPVVTNDCHYILPEHANIQRTLKNISWGTNNGAGGDSATVTKDHFTDSLWLKKPTEVYATFRKHHEYLPKQFVADGMRNTIEIFEKVKDFRMPEDKRYLPTFRPGINSKDMFKKLTVKLLKEFLASDRIINERSEYVARFAKEYSVITKYGLEDYFLIVWDIIRFANSKEIVTGLGRGSAAGCLISYLMDIVRIDPLEHKLLFERFLNENRCKTGELPDIDLDFESDRRKEIKEYIYKTYGHDRVCEIGTYGRMKLKTALIDFSKSMGVASRQEILSITTKLDLDKEDVDDLVAAAESDPRLMKLLTGNDEFGFSVTEIIGQIKSQGVHPAGIVICSEPIYEITPIKTQKKTVKPEDIVGLKKHAESRIITTQAEDKYVIAQGLMKLDVLGVKEYDVVKYVLSNIKSELTLGNYVQKIMKWEREKPDKLVWRMFQEGDSHGVFQFSSTGMQQLLKMMRPNCVNDLIAANALYRPGCLENGWHEQYCRRKHGEEAVEFAHPDIEAALGDTYGVIVFQEDFMAVIHKLGGISLVDTDTIRSALGKKDKVKLGKFKDRFVKGASEKIGKFEATALWDQIEKASSYSFNRSHSAAYAVLAYISQYLKAYYPAEFWAAQLDWDVRRNDLEDMLSNRRAASAMGVKFVLPDINRSKERFYVDGSEVVWSLTSVKGCGPKAVRAVVAKQPFASFDDFYNRTNKKDIKHNNIVSFITAGVFDSMGDRRDLLMFMAAKKKGKKFVSMSDEEMMREFHASMGFFEMKIKKIRPVFSKHVITEQELAEYDPSEFVAVGGMITEVRCIKTKRGENMGFATLMDLDESIELTIFPSSWSANREKLIVGQIVEIAGKKSSWNGRQNHIEVQKIILR